MSLSVDQLKRLEFALSTDLEHHKNQGITPSWKLSKIADELQAIRELIAIKEAEPVEIVSSIERGGFAIRQGDKALHKSTKLIRKPE